MAVSKAPEWPCIAPPKLEIPILTSFILATIVAAGVLLLHPRLANAKNWRAAITPLASIIGSGFLVLGPILDASYGYLAPLVMAALCFVAFLFGAAIRFNIAAIEAEPERNKAERVLEVAASWTLTFAYIISVAYYLNLFGAFAVSLNQIAESFHAKIVTSGVFLLILAVGWNHGFHALERMEQISVGLKLAVIAGLLAGLAAFFWDRASTGALMLNSPGLGAWASVSVAFGLIVTVQGFETSRYLRANYDAATRIRSMRLAQYVSTAIYMIYVLLLAYVFAPGTLHLSETAIIGMMQVVAPILPALLVAAALSAQFSAAVADTSGTGGLVAELTGGRIPPRQAYAILAGLGLALTWSASIFEIISYASRAFAAYYALQSLIAAVTAHNSASHKARAPAFFLLAVLGAVIALFGTPVE
jgi:hypothetical protein